MEAVTVNGAWVDIPNQRKQEDSMTTFRVIA